MSIIGWNNQNLSLLQKLFPAPQLEKSWPVGSGGGCGGDGVLLGVEEGVESGSPGTLQPNLVWGVYGNSRSCKLLKSFLFTGASVWATGPEQSTRFWEWPPLYVLIAHPAELLGLSSSSSSSLQAWRHGPTSGSHCQAPLQLHNWTH